MKDNTIRSSNYEDYEIDLGILMNSLNQSKKFITIFCLICFLCFSASQFKFSFFLLN